LDLGGHLEDVGCTQYSLREKNRTSKGKWILNGWRFGLVKGIAKKGETKNKCNFITAMTKNRG